MKTPHHKPAEKPAEELPPFVEVTKPVEPAAEKPAAPFVIPEGYIVENGSLKKNGP